MKGTKRLVDKFMGNGLGNKSFGRRLIDDIGDAGQFVEKGVKKSAMGIKNLPTTAKSLPKSALIMNDRKGAHLGNLYTGKKLNGYTIGGVAAVGTLAATGGASGLTGEKKMNPSSASDMSLFDIKGVVSKPIGPAEAAVSPVMTADGTAGAENTKSKAPTLNASGDIVFGMHNQRH